MNNINENPELLMKLKKHYEQMREAQRRYYMKTRVEKIEKMKIYNENNKERHKESRKKYYEKNKDKINERSKKRYHDTKNEILFAEIKD